MRVRHWTMQELAMLIGMRALGENYEAIASTLARSEADVATTLRTARCLIRAEEWIEPLLTVNSVDRTRYPERRAAAVPARQYRVSPHVDQIAELAERNPTASLMGDPQPDRRATKGPRKSRISLPTVKGYSNDH
ncbi:hypothetical protein [Pannonibacter sp. SL95]|uniref:hypothetical protein n=1 Tax=Pannonibacter sp. SL95 TaxID=2995153 RepID=UPI0022754C85|nr:hypothetical protein [Pannonibacter sp. SL95]MCY1705212.1 hypothetical protein [Pannonibacter sp. SL95]